MLRLTTVFASTAATSAAYYADYLASAPGEEPGVWCGAEAVNVGLSGPVDVDSLELLLSGRDPLTGTRLGLEFRKTSVAGFDATFSAPKSVSAWWALTGDRRLLEAHDVAVTAALEHLERFGSTTRVRSNGGRLHPDTGGLIVAAFRQTTSRADDPQLHTHAVISSKVRTADGRWLALDARYLLRHQRMLSDLYQSVLRVELSHRLGVVWEPVVDGKADIAGVPVELRAVFSKRHATIEAVVADQVAEFRQRHGRDPSDDERSLMTRKAAEETRSRKSGHGVADLTTRWQREVAALGWTGDQLTAAIEGAAFAAEPRIVDGLTVAQIVEEVSLKRSSWSRPDVIRVLCQRMQPVSPIDGHRWAQVIERAASKVLDRCIDLDPPDPTTRRLSDGRSLWIAPVAARYSTDVVLAQEEHILTWARDTQLDPAAPSTTIDVAGLDVLQGAAAASVAGGDRLAVVVGPVGAGKTRMLAAAAADLARHRRPGFGVAPTAKATRVLERDAAIVSTTVAKLLYEWTRPELPRHPYRLPAGTTLIVDEAGMISTPDLDHLVSLAEQQRWRLVLVGDHAQLQAVGRGGLFAELCANSRVEHLEQLHRFTHRWEAEASLQLRAGNPDVLDADERQGRIHPGDLDHHWASPGIVERC
ncbi:MAG: MobF family relaxase [Ilumatobacteraceae bacterium]